MPHNHTERYIALPTRAPRGKTEWQNAYEDIRQGLLDAVQKVEQEYARVPPSVHDTVYIGVTGLAMMQYTLSSRVPFLNHRSTQHKNVLDPGRLRYQADRNLYTVIHRNHIPAAVQDSAHASFLETPMGVATLLIARCVACMQQPVNGDEHYLECLHRHWDASIHLLGGTIKQILAEDEDDAVAGRQDDEGSEVLYGRAGLLYALLYLRKVVDEVKGKGYFECLSESLRRDVEGITRDVSLKTVVDGIIRRGRAGAKRYRSDLEREMTQVESLPPLMWRWHGKAYLGGAHGVVGILQMLLSCPAPAIEEYIGDIAFAVQWIMACQDEEGNWPTKAPPGPDPRHHSAGFRANDLVQWCHGAPGAVIMLSTFISRSSPPHRLFRLSPDFELQVKTAIRRGADLVYERGLLRKGLGLCHGVAGSVYPLISASGVLDSSSDTSYFKKAAHLAQLATLAGQFEADGEMATPDRPWSLYEGLSGMCCAWADLLKRATEAPEYRIERASGMPGYDDLQ